MKTTYEVTGTLTDEHTVKLDKNLPISPSKVRLVVEPVEERERVSRQEVLARIHARQRERGHTAPTKEQVDAHIRRERDSWER